MVRIVILFCVASLAGACAPTEPQPAPPPDTPAASAADGSALPAPPEGEATEDDEAMTSPAVLSVSSDRAGVFYLDGERRDETLPAVGLEVAAGWHHAQVLYEGGRLLSAPRPAHLEPGRRVAIRVATPFDDATHAAAAEGSGAAPLPPELDPVVFEFPPPPAAEGSGAATDDIDHAGAEVDAEGSGEGSGSQAPPLPFPRGRAGLVVASDRPGELFIDGYATGLHTPVNVHIPPGTYRFQIVHDGGETLSRSLSAGIAPHAIRWVNFYGTADFILR